MKLYAATILGHKFYFIGELTTEIIEAAELLCVRLESNANKSDPQKLFMLLLDHIKSELDCSVVPVDVEHIFRINY